MKTNEDFIKAVNDGVVTLEHFAERYMEGFIDGRHESDEVIHFGLYTAALLAAEKLYGLDDKGIYSLFKAMRAEVEDSLCERDKAREKWAEMHDRLNRVANDIPDPDMEDKAWPDGKFYSEK